MNCQLLPSHTWFFNFKIVTYPVRGGIIITNWKLNCLKFGTNHEEIDCSKCMYTSRDVNSTSVIMTNLSLISTMPHSKWLNKPSHTRTISWMSFTKMHNNENNLLVFISLSGHCNFLAELSFKLLYICEYIFCYYQHACIICVKQLND